MHRPGGSHCRVEPRRDPRRAERLAAAVVLLVRQRPEGSKQRQQRPEEQQQREQRRALACLALCGAAVVRPQAVQVGLVGGVHLVVPRTWGGGGAGSVLDKVHAGQVLSGADGGTQAGAASTSARSSRRQCAMWCHGHADGLSVDSAWASTPTGMGSICSD